MADREPQDVRSLSPAAASRAWLRPLAVVLVAAGIVAATGFVHLFKAPPAPATPPPGTAPAAGALKMPERLFVGWDKPDLALVVTGETHGYLLPCGCSRPQVGGLERRANVLRLLRERGWPVLAVDVGDVPQKTGPAGLPNIQGRIKYRYAMHALNLMGYTAVGLGEYEAANGLVDVIGEYALNEKTPKVVVANLKDEFPDSGVVPWTLAAPKGAGLRVGVAGAVGAMVADTKIKDTSLTFTKVAEALPKALAAMDKERPDLRVLVYQGSDTRGMTANGPAEAVACARAFPPFQVVACLSDTDEARFDPARVTHEGTKQQTLVVSVGHKGKYVGVVGVYKTGKPEQPFEFKYQAVALTEEFLTPDADADGHPVTKLLEKYTAELKEKNVLAEYGQTKHPLQVQFAKLEPDYVGSEACKSCHQAAYTVWQNSAHSHAYKTLVDAKRPSNRQHDGECIVCHTVGFGHVTGFPGPKEDPAMFTKLQNVGCESCHGPGGAHVIDPDNAELRKAMNPWRPAADETVAQKEARLKLADAACVKCHDSENDVNWYTKRGVTGFEVKWPAIAHPTPPGERKKKGGG